MSEPNRRPQIVLGAIGAAVGGALGYWAFRWIAQQGFYALIVPPGLLGLVAGYCVGRRSMPFAIGCGIAGLVLGLFTEWRFAPFVADASFGYFMTHVQQLKPITLLMLVIGSFISYRLALGLDDRSEPVGRAG